MNQSAKAQEPSMEEILASIRRIIADDDARAPAAKAPEPPPPPPPKPAPPKAAPPPPPPKPAAPPPKPAPPPPKAAAPAPAPAPAAAEGAAMSQDDIDAMLAGFDSPAPPPVARAPEPEPEPEPPAPANDILDLTESMAAAAEPPPPPPAPAPTNFRTIDGHSDVVFSEPRSRPEAPERPLLSSTTSAAVDSAFNALAQTVLVQNARTLEDLVKEMLRPMLKSWLDDNLPSLVERIVKAEIERVSRGRNGG